MVYYEKKHKDITVLLNWGGEFVPHVHEAVEILICLEGNLIATCGGQTKTLRPGDAMVAFSYNVHAYSRSVGRGVILLISTDMLSMFSARLKTRQYDNFYLEQNPSLVDSAMEIWNQWQRGCSRDVLVGYVYVILGVILETLPSRPETEPPASPDNFTKILEYLADNYAQPLNLKNVARKFGIDHCHLSRTFHAKLSCGYLEYVHQLRIEDARQRLIRSSDKISQIALDSGFSDIRTFNRVFLQLTGMSPREYRNQNGARIGGAG